MKKYTFLILAIFLIVAILLYAVLWVNRIQWLTYTPERGSLFQLTFSYPETWKWAKTSDYTLGTLMAEDPYTELELKAMVVVKSDGLSTVGSGVLKKAISFW